MKILTTRFGEIEISEGQAYAFPEGILGFTDIDAYCILDNPKGGPFLWLQAVKLPSLAFIICDPRLFLPDYKVKVKQEDLISIQLGDVAEGVVFVIVTVPKDPMEMTANLQGPLVFNSKAKLAKQLVLVGPEYEIRYKILSKKE